MLFLIRPLLLRTGLPPDPDTMTLSSTMPPAAARHRERVIDSVAATINTDSLYRTYRAMLVASDPEPLLTRASCIESELRWRFGMFPAQHAIDRMRDTLWQGKAQEQKAMEARFPTSVFITTSDAACGPHGPRGRLFVDGVALEPLRTDTRSRMPRYAPRH